MAAIQNIAMHSLSGRITSVSSGVVSGGLHVIPGAPTGDMYTGAYTVDPLVNSQTILATKSKYCTKNITVTEVPRYETANPAGGTTFYIGE